MATIRSDVSPLVLPGASVATSHGLVGLQRCLEVLADETLRGSKTFWQFLSPVLEYLHSKWELDPRTGDDKVKTSKALKFTSPYDSAVDEVLAHYVVVANSLVPLVDTAARTGLLTAPAVQAVGIVSAPVGVAAGAAAGDMAAAVAEADVGAAPAAAVAVKVAAPVDANLADAALGDVTSDEATPLGAAVSVPAAKLARARFDEWQGRLEGRIEKEKLCE